VTVYPVLFKLRRMFLVPGVICHIPASDGVYRVSIKPKTAGLVPPPPPPVDPPPSTTKQNKRRKEVVLAIYYLHRQVQVLGGPGSRQADAARTSKTRPQTNLHNGAIISITITGWLCIYR
jgi:hypothetical protein